MKKFKNNKETPDSWVGQQIQSGEYYEIQTFELFKWQNDSKVLSDIGSGYGIMNDGTADILDIANAINFLKNQDTTPKDSDGSPLQRVKISTTGWHYQLHGLEFKTSQLNSIISKKVDGTDFGFTTIKCYDSDNNELITQLDCDIQSVKTVIDWEPTYDYEIVGGTFRQSTIPASDIRMWVVGVPDIPESSGGSKAFATNLNIKFIGLEESVSVDGRTPKYLTYNSTFHTNKLRIILKHVAGFKHDMHFMFELFKP